MVDSWSSSSTDLTKFNFRNEEDYRWVVLRKTIPMWFFHVTNLTFIGSVW
jgi:hypothetical protein